MNNVIEIPVQPPLVVPHNNSDRIRSSNYKDNVIEIPVQPRTINNSSSGRSSSFNNNDDTELVVRHINRFIIAHSVGISETEIALLREYGKVIVFDPSVYLNIPIDKLEFDYILLDLQRKEDRRYFQNIEPDVLSQSHVVSYCYTFEKDEEFHEDLGSINIITKFPDRQAFKADFDRLLLQKKIAKPRAALSCFKSCLRLVKGDWK
jgi:hypothetical protein